MTETEVTEVVKQGTIVPNPDFDSEWAAKRFKNAMKGIGTDEKMIIQMLVSHDSLQREEIEQAYKRIYGRDLVTDLKGELGGHFENAVVAMLTSKYDLLVEALSDSLTIIGTDVQTLTEILCCRESEDINGLCWWYENTLERSLDEDISENVSGDFKAIMRSMISATRPADAEEEVEEERAKMDAKNLYDAVVDFRSDSDKSDLLQLFNSSSFAHLKLVFDNYESQNGEPIEVTIESKLSGDARDGLLAIVKRVKDPPGFFAERLNASMLGAGTDDRTLIRIIVSRAEEDLAAIKERYYQMYGSTLAEDIKADTGGDYAKLLLAIIKNNEKKI